MSSNRLIYDSCAYQTSLNESAAPLSYVLNPIKYENCSKCRNELGLVGGTAVSNISGNLVDLESDLRGSTRANSQCPSKKYHAPTNNQIVYQDKIDKSIKYIDTNLLHLPSCQMIDYKPVPNNPPLNLPQCYQLASE